MGEDVRFPLPFQWEDDNFLSPFVRTSEANVVQLVDWLISPGDCESELGVSSAATSPRLCITDLGCGDGHAVSQMIQLLAEKLQRRRRLGEAVALFLQNVQHVTGRGIDLDPNLIDAAKQLTVSPVPGAIPSEGSAAGAMLAVELSLIFDVEDFRDPTEEISVRFARDSGTHILYLFLLPVALDQLRAQLEEVLPHVFLLVSNRWDIPYLASRLRGKVGDMWIYQAGSP